MSASKAAYERLHIGSSGDRVVPQTGLLKQRGSPAHKTPRRALSSSALVSVQAMVHWQLYRVMALWGSELRRRPSVKHPRLQLNVIIRRTNWIDAGPCGAGIFASITGSERKGALIVN
jgi:hypothetical protein